MLNRVTAWQPGAWCCTTLKLCDRFEREESGEWFRYPEQWLFFLWRPMDRAVPFMRPDAYGFDTREPVAAIGESTGVEPVYFVEDRECVWDALLDIPLQCDKLEPWLRAIVADWQERKRTERARFNQEWYGQEEHNFRHFMQRVIRDADFGWVSPKEGGISHIRCIQCEVEMPTHTRARAWARLLADGRLELEIQDCEQHPDERAGGYCFEPGSTELLAAFLALRTNTPALSPPAMMELLPAAFSSWFALRDWAVETALPHQRYVD